VLRGAFDELGLDANVVEELHRALETPPARYLDVDAWLASPASELMRPLWLGRSSRGFGASILLGEVRDGDALAATLADLEGVHFVDRVRDLSQLLERYRIDTTRLVLIAYAVVLIALIFRFRVLAGVRVMLPSLLSAGLTLGILSLGGAELNLFHVLGLLLVLGLAVDYGVIFGENATSEATTLFAVALSVLTTVTAFGLMVTSSAPPLRSVGASVSIGIVLALLFSPLAAPGARAITGRARDA
jgi:predicted exporter